MYDSPSRVFLVQAFSHNLILLTPNNYKFSTVRLPFLLLHSTHFIYPEVEKTYGKCDNYSQVLTLFPFALTVRLDDDDLEMLKNTFVYKANVEEPGGTA